MLEWGSGASRLRWTPDPAHTNFLDDGFVHRDEKGYLPTGTELHEFHRYKHARMKRMPLWLETPWRLPVK